MPVISFHFDKLLVEKKKPLEVPMKVDTGVKITDVHEEELPLSGGRKEKVLRFFYSYTVEYQPKQAFIEIAGNLLYHEPKDVVDKILAEWKKSKKFETGVGKVIVNNVLMRCQIKALTLSQDAGLPPHIRLPLINTAPKGKKKADSYIG